MSLWLHAAAGGLQGLGTSIMAADAEKSEARGLALREKYLAARQGREHKYRTGEAALTRTHQAGEAALTREHQTVLSEGQIAAADKRVVEGRTHDLTMEEIRGSNTMKRLTTQLEASAREGHAQRTAAMERTQATINAGLQRATAEGGLEQYKDLLAETLKRAGTDPNEFDADGNAVTNWGLYDEMLTLTAAAKGVPPWRQPVRTGMQIVAYAQKLGDVATAVSWLQERHFRVPERAIAQARQLAAPRLLGDEKR